MERERVSGSARRHRYIKNWEIELGERRVRDEFGGVGYMSLVNRAQNRFITAGWILTEETG